MFTLDHLKFLDSNQFLDASLDALVHNLNISKHSFKIQPEVVDPRLDAKQPVQPAFDSTKLVQRPVSNSWKPCHFYKPPDRQVHKNSTNYVLDIRNVSSGECPVLKFVPLKTGTPRLWDDEILVENLVRTAKSSASTLEENLRPDRIDFQSLEKRFVAQQRQPWRCKSGTQAVSATTNAESCKLETSRGWFPHVYPPENFRDSSARVYTISEIPVLESSQLSETAQVLRNFRGPAPGVQNFRDCSTRVLKTSEIPAPELRAVGIPARSQNVHRDSEPVLKCSSKLPAPESPDIPFMQSPVPQFPSGTSLNKMILIEDLRKQIKELRAKIEQLQNCEE
ncbi:hypothetical protein HNY73_007496 [Argiope bruennichi]|uniref:Uncharacterized protein n=1 Tax=Argiope bruennichi TaxID=94029 RepID=A0A8T0FER4_ARGBR|nr:hypothetical protein HNY73_007496 [Argiope bruennichi]